MDVENFVFLLLPSVAEDPLGATDCTTQWNKNQNLLYCLYYTQYKSQNWRTLLTLPSPADYGGLSRAPGLDMEIQELQGTMNAVHCIMWIFSNYQSTFRT